jgi:TIR domain
MILDLPRSDRPFQVFLAHSSADRAAVQDLYRLLKPQGFTLWLDEIDIFPGQAWQQKIEAGMLALDVVLVCFSRKSFTQERYVRHASELALDLKKRHPALLINLVRLEEVNLPPQLTKWASVDLFQPHGHKQLVGALRSLAKAMGATVTPSATTTKLDIQSQHYGVSSADFCISFDPDLSPEQIRSTLQALADYYRACGGVGFEIDFELEEARVPELANV